MSIDIERVKSAVRKAIEPPGQPSPLQVSDICRLTYLDEARKEIQRMVDRRLRYPDSYGSAEVLHTLTLVQLCLPNASSDFVDFCHRQVQLVVDLTRYGRNGSPAEREESKLVCNRASSLSKLLLDPARLADKRRAVSAATASTMPVAPPPTHSRAIPLPSSPLTPGKQDVTLLTRQVPGGKFLPTPDPTPPKPFSKLEPDGKVKANAPATKKDRVHSVLLSKKEDIATMTFKGGKEGLETILVALDDMLRSEYLVKKDPEELVKALTCLHHCLYWGSDPFVAHCRERTKDFDTLRRHSIPQVRGHADAVVNLLANRSRLQEERQSRASLMPSTHSPVPAEPLQGAPGDIVLEPVFDISKIVIISGTGPVAGGGYSDVWKGVFWTNSGKETVSRHQIFAKTKIPQERLQKRLNRELHAWRTLSHKNICPFYGIILRENTDVGMVSPFYSNGNVLDYVKKNQSINPLEMLQGIADGVVYLHSREIAHGDIKCANVMVSDKGIPMLIDFGLAQAIDKFADTTGYTTSNLASSLRWSAPELLIGDSPFSSKSEKSDVYAFASTCIEIMTLECPYPALKDPQVLKRIVDEVLPDRPSMKVKWSPCDELWNFLVTCWAKDPQRRPNIVAVRRKLAQFYDGSVLGTQ